MQRPDEEKTFELEMKKIVPLDEKIQRSMPWADDTMFCEKFWLMSARCVATNTPVMLVISRHPVEQGAALTLIETRDVSLAYHTTRFKHGLHKFVVGQKFSVTVPHPRLWENVHGVDTRIVRNDLRVIIRKGEPLARLEDHAQN